MATCYNLLSCFPTIYADELSVGDASLAPYDGLVVYINGDYNKPYTVASFEDVACTNPLVITSIDSIPTCPAGVNFKASLVDRDGEISVDINGTCSAITIVDNSNYDLNISPGHLRANFTDYRVITINKPNGTWVMSSVPGASGVDQVIAAPSSGTDSFTYTLLDEDVDGIYEVVLCSYPTWTELAQYASAPLTVVYYNGVLYKCIATTAGDQPDISPDYWEVYEPTTEEMLLTRYCTIQRIVVLCINILKCYERLTHEAFCLMDSNFCNDDVLCKNKKFLAAVKMRVLLDAAEISVNKSAWNEVDRQINLMNQICGC